MPVSDTQYRGRFAPSPTGPLHLGSLIAALASFLDARHCGGAWLVRMDDLDPPREERGAAQSILHSLLHHGLQWDEPVIFQSGRAEDYAKALTALAQGGNLFYCDCSRAAMGTAGTCTGDCLSRQERVSTPHSIRVRVPLDCDITFLDQLQGPQRFRLGRSTPDFVVKRKDGLDAYQLAVVVDDFAQGISHVVRGSDLLDTTPRQVFLQQLLGYPQPQYSHLPVVTTDNGQKFSKQNHAPALENDRAPTNLRRALTFLQQETPPGTLTSTRDLLGFAIEHWQPQQVPDTLAISASRIDWTP